MAHANKTFPHTEDKEDFECPICFELIKEPLCLKPCGHFLCKQCHLQLRRVVRSKKCPMCRAEIQDAKPSVEIERKVAQLKGQCPGCDELIALSGMKQHIAKCPVLMDLQKYNKKPSWQNHAKHEPRLVNQKAQRFGQALNCHAYQNKNAISADIPELQVEDCLYDEQEFGRFNSPNCQYSKIARPFKTPHVSPGAAQTPSTNNAPRPIKTPDVSPRDAQTPSTHITPKKTRNNRSARGNENPDSSNQFDLLLNPNEKAGDVTGACGGARQKHPSMRKCNNRVLQQPQRASCDSDSDHESGASSAQDNKPKYDCPFCGQSSLTLCELMKHCQELHASLNQQVVCPVCASMPWGDTNRKSTHFIHHLNLRHNFDYQAYMDEDEDEAAMLARAIKASLQCR